MATNQYNNSTADVEALRAGTILYRILSASATYAANTYNPNPRPLTVRLLANYRQLADTRIMLQHTVIMNTE
jgi:hypothetical protein